MAQTFRTLHNFAPASGVPPFSLCTNADGTLPIAGLVLSGNSLYGATEVGGSTGYGTLFRNNTDGTGFTNLHIFAAAANPFYFSGTEPIVGVVINSKLFGVTAYDGYTAYGSVFSTKTDGTGFTTLYNFTDGADGANPYGNLIFSGNVLFGTTSKGGIADGGTVYAINPDGTGLTNVNTGGNPKNGLILSGTNLYGTTLLGGDSTNGTIFKLNADGTGLTNLHSFNFSDGSNPGRLVLSGNTLYGATQQGGPADYGTIFAVNTDGTGFTNLHFFNGGDGQGPDGLVLLHNTLFGTTGSRGPGGNGTIFAINTDGTGFKNLHNFAPTVSGNYFATNSDGVNPEGLMLSGNTLYGTTFRGGSSGTGTVFSLAMAPQLNFTFSSTSIVLSWPTNVSGFDYTGYTLQSTTNLALPAGWSAVSPAPVAINGQFVVTNAIITGAQIFYRLTE